MVVQPKSLAERFAAVGVSGTACAVWLPDHGVTVAAGVVTSYLDVINGYDAAGVLADNRPSVGAAWTGGKATIHYSGSQVLVCTAAPLLAAASGDDSNLCIIVGRTLAAMETSKTRVGFFSSDATKWARIRAGASGDDYYYRNGLYLGAGLGATHQILSPCYVAGSNIGTAATLRVNGSQRLTSTMDIVALTLSCFAMGAGYATSTSAITEPMTGDHGPVIICNPATVDWTKLQQLLMTLGYGAGGLQDALSTTAWLLGDAQGPGVAGYGALETTARLIGEQDVLSGAPATEALVQTGDAVNDGTVAQWAVYTAAISRVADLAGTSETLPIHVHTIGNHEVVDVAWEANQDAALPWEASVRGAAHYYSYATGLIRWIVLDSIHDVAGQAAWLATELASATEPWIFLVYHYRVYPCDTLVNTYADHLAWVQAGEDSAKKPFHAAAHVHLLTRTTPLLGGVRNDASGSVYLIPGRAAAAHAYDTDTDRVSEITLGERTDTFDAATGCAFALEPAATSQSIMRLRATATTLWVGSYTIDAQGVAVLVDTATYTKAA